MNIVKLTQLNLFLLQVVPGRICF